MINSILDNDTYKFSMQQAVLERFPNAQVSYVFKNRDTSMKFTSEAFGEIKRRINAMGSLQMTPLEYEYIKGIDFFKPSYIEYLRNYRYDPSEVDVSLNSTNGELFLKIKGSWHHTILWEVPLMAIISEVYFEFVDTDWSYEGQVEQAKQKAEKLRHWSYADFGTRRRRSYISQDIVVRTMSQKNMRGTSNVHFAMKYGIKFIGTMAHEFLMGVSALRGLRHANHNALHEWVKVYDADLGIALTDTYGTEAFFEDFDLLLSKTFDGVRHDSGCPFKFTDRVIEHYKSVGIDPMTKVIVFSDGLDVDTVDKLGEYCHQKSIRCSFGIGTHLTNDYKNSAGEKSKPLNMVIKMWECDDIPVVKLSDNPGKAIGDRDAIRVAKWTFFGTPLDS